MSGVGAAVVGAGVVGAIGANLAAGTQASAQEQAANTQAGMFNTIVGQEQPFLQGGYGAETALNQLLGTAPATGAGGGAGAGLPGYDPSSGYMLSPSGGLTRLLPGGTAAGSGGAPGTVASTGLPAGFLTQTFNPTQAQLENYPGFQFSLQTGGQAIRNADTPGVGALSGPALKDLMNFNQGVAQSYYNNYFNQFQTQQNNIFNRLSSIAQLGQNAAGNLGTAGTQLGTGIAQAQAAAGGSQAAGIVGATNSISGAAIPLAYLMSGQGAGGGGFGMSAMSGY